jgi:hypothetical protein
MKELLWKAIAFAVSRKPVADYLIERSKRTPYFDLEGYMNRWWLFNAYNPDTSKDDASRYKRSFSAWLPSIRIHHILREDLGRHLHDHPWNARTIILKGWYVERRLAADGSISAFRRKRGDTAEINHGQYHSIDVVSEGGVYTMFFTWQYIGTWGFLVNGTKVPWREYENA